jgi:hypothetical protein
MTTLANLKQICALWSALLEGETWLTTIRKYQHHRHGRTAAEGRMVLDQIVDQEGAKVADGNFSVVKRFVSSAWKKSTTLTTRTCACSGSLWRSGERSSHGG